MTLANCFTGTVGALGGAFVGLLAALAAQTSGMGPAESAVLAAGLGTGSGLLLGAGMYYLLHNRDRERVAPATPEAALPASPEPGEAAPAVADPNAWPPAPHLAV